MYGVVLWSDPYVKKAVIWCEDQGNLAYYDAADASGVPSHKFFEAGDYVEFDVTMDRDLRRAQNAQAIFTSNTRNFPHTLVNANATSGRHIQEPRFDVTHDTSGRVIKLSDHVGVNSPNAVSVNRRG